MDSISNPFIQKNTISRYFSSKMSRRVLKDLSASVHQRLLNISRERNEDFRFVLQRFANERLLYRLSKSEYVNQFILKGATLFIAWSEDRYRPTKDLDFLGFGDASAPAIKKIFQGICDMEDEKNGLQFDRNSVKIVEIREGMDYPEKRITLIACLGNARINLRIDIGFGDKVFPEAQWQHFPTLLNLPKPWIRMYSPESVIAEKLHTIVNLGIANSRMRDYYDLFRLSEQFNFKGAILTNAVKQTFERRETAIPEEVPLGLSPSFSNDRNKQTQWRAFLKKNNVHGIPDSLGTVINRISIFLEPILKAAALGTSFSKKWKAGIGWE